MLTVQKSLIILFYIYPMTRSFNVNNWVYIEKSFKQTSILIRKFYHCVRAPSVRRVPSTLGLRTLPAVSPGQRLALGIIAMEALLKATTAFAHAHETCPRRGGIWSHGSACPLRAGGSRRKEDHVMWEQERQLIRQALYGHPVLFRLVQYVLSCEFFILWRWWLQVRNHHRLDSIV